MSDGICAVSGHDFMDAVAESEILLSYFLFQAAFFFLSGILVMTGCMTLIILDWTHDVASDGH